MATDRYSDMKYEVQLEEEFNERHIEIPQWVRDIKEPEKRRQAMRKILRDDDKVFTRQKARYNNSLWTVFTIIAAILLVVLIAGILTHWRFGIPAKAEVQPTSETVSLAPAPSTSVPQPTPTLYPIQPTPTLYPVQPTYTPLATQVLLGNTVVDSASDTITSTNVLGDPISTWMQGNWSVKEYDLANDPIIKGWLERLQDPAPALWQVFPNVPNPLVPEFPVETCKDNPDKKCVPWGMEYGTYDTPYCWQSPCDVPVGAWEYRYISGDYQFLDLSCKGDMKTGCMLVILNEMDQSFTWRSQYVDNGFTLRGRYFNGDHLEWGVWGLISVGSANMLNMPTIGLPGEMLNTGVPGNSGANCGVPQGCGSVDVNLVVTVGDRVLAVLHTIVTRP